ncbi:PLP-dependent aminotransferase family protein [Pseudomonas donghuensis]|uniref:PLP-dependent aminotransferase family protein n=1 Tax=Pseudomonas donghuensis TaxID=1163398 RepID=A0AAP0SH73_9PSED|nr:PLP-dependent aminotransferase family protein [Pseudomonas donghuensis]MDF9893605.1 GntR family transcriptional regulator/MocR family aminotransferase [Pseudomonas vranovensis]KDN99177.1 PLP-dependent aminotransferase family protein [Pseudomonas donghuensis]MBF4209706.1 PLP-dependent aminotransferase family protein [Pseudomonas donghuensis]MCP6694348.1 PLP-dependent aminotransferase family protein [Pseudomonas donghuensis]MCP6697988.1 PLP-dependent aminotransferase family protein [Pseudomon
MKSPAGLLFSGIELDRDSATPLYRQLYLQIRKQILTGRLQGGIRLPSTRTLSQELQLSRITLLNAFDQLIAEGFLVSRTGAGTYVSDEWQRSAGAELQAPAPPKLSELSQSMLSLRSDHFRGVSYAHCGADTPTSFLPSHGAFEAFPQTLWKRLLNRHGQKPSKAMLGYGELQGLQTLRQAIAEYVFDARGIDCNAEQVVIVSGAQQAFNLLAMLLLNPDEPVWMEDPGHIAARIAFQAHGCRVVPVPIDDQGLDVQHAIDECPEARLVFTTPSRQHPLGMTLSHNRRLELIDWAAASGSWIIEDDCDSELRYRGRQLPALYAMDRGDRVIYVGTFSKVLFPSLRLGYVILPPALVEPFCTLRAVLDRSPPTLLQAVTADFMSEGHFIGHIRRMRTLYQARQQCLLEVLQRRLGGFLQVAPVEAGMHLIAWLPPQLDDQALARQLAGHGVHTYALSDYCLTRYLPPALLLGFAGTPQDQAEAKVEALVQALRAIGHPV